MEGKFNIGRKLRRARYLKDWSQDDLAAAMERSVGAVRDWEQGRPMHQSDLIAAAHILGQKPEALKGALPLIEPGHQLSLEDALQLATPDERQNFQKEMRRQSEFLEENRKAWSEMTNQLQEMKKQLRSQT